MPAWPEETPERSKRTTIQGIRGLTPRGSRPAVRRIRSDRVHGFDLKGDIPDIRDERLSLEAVMGECAGGTVHHLLLEIGSEYSHPETSPLRSDSARPAERVEEGTAPRTPGEVHQGARELRVKRDRHRERPSGDLPGLHRGTLNLVLDLSEEEVPSVLEETELSVRTIEIDAPRRHRRPDPTLQFSLLGRCERAVRAHTEGLAREAETRGRSKHGGERAQREHAIDIAGQGDPFECPPRGAKGVNDQDLRRDRKSTRLNSSHRTISYAVF